MLEAISMIDGVGYARWKKARGNHTPAVELDLVAVAAMYAELVVRPGLVEDAWAN